VCRPKTNWKLLGHDLPRFKIRFQFQVVHQCSSIKSAFRWRLRIEYDQPHYSSAFNMKLRRYTTAATTAAAAAVAANIKAKTAAGVCVKSQAGG